MSNSHAVVLGGGMAGMLAAAALVGHADAITIVEGDSFPETPLPRKGLPQGYHSHMFMGGGAEAMDQLLPGTSELLLAAGAHRRELPGGSLTLSSVGWHRRGPSPAYSLVCSRELMDHIVRQQTLRNKQISVLEQTQVKGLVGDASRITGVRIQRGDAAAETIDADFVVDATGRRSQTPKFLAALGLPAVEEETVDSGLSYSTLLFQAPVGGSDIPVILIQPQAGTGRPGAGATLFPIENGLWICTMTGTRGGEPPADEEGFRRFAESQRHPIIAEMISGMEPLGEVKPYRGTANRRRFYDKLPVPEGFVVIGDAATALNPVYAHGMSVAALGAVALRRALEANGGLKPGTSGNAQTAIARAADFAWTTASGQDRGFPGTKANREMKVSKGQARFADRMSRTALSDPVVGNAVYEIYTLAAPPSRGATLPVLLSTLRGPRKPDLTAEQAIAQFPELGSLRRTRISR
jgi:2-polyprenyl-6-methoxyphenol hydroxylase-like FAD-dependent oxidoreductase